MKPSDRYLKIVEWSAEDACYVGVCPGLMLGGIHGNDEAKVYAELCRAVEEWISIHEQDGVPLPHSPFPNLPAHQRAVQRLADEFNAAQCEWERQHPAQFGKKGRKKRKAGSAGALKPLRKQIGFHVKEGRARYMVKHKVP